MARYTGRPISEACSVMRAGPSLGWPARSRGASPPPRILCHGPQALSPPGKCAPWREQMIRRHSRHIQSHRETFFECHRLPIRRRPGLTKCQQRTMLAGLRSLPSTASAPRKSSAVASGQSGIDRFRNGSGTCANMVATPLACSIAAPGSRPTINFQASIRTSTVSSFDIISGFTSLRHVFHHSIRAQERPNF